MRVVWSEKRSNVAEFERPSAGGSYITARESHVVRDLRVLQNGLTEPAVQPYAAGREFLVVDADDRSFVSWTRGDRNRAAALPGADHR